MPTPMSRLSILTNLTERSAKRSVQDTRSAQFDAADLIWDGAASELGDLGLDCDCDDAGEIAEQTAEQKQLAKYDEDLAVA